MTKIGGRIEDLELGNPPHAPLVTVNDFGGIFSVNFINTAPTWVQSAQNRRWLLAQLKDFLARRADL